MIRNGDDMRPRARARKPEQGQAERSGPLVQLSDERHGLTIEAELFHTPGEREPFATVPINGHAETWPVRSGHFAYLLEREYYQRCGRHMMPRERRDLIRELEG